MVEFTILATFIVSQFLYVCSAVDTPINYVKVISRLMPDFILAGKNQRLR